MNSKSSRLAIISVMMCFFCMGFVDLVGIASNYVQKDLELSDSVANVFPSLVFVWFLIFSVPTGVLMNVIGRRRTVLLSLFITLVALLLPLLGNQFAIMVWAFSLLGIGNAIMQTSLNPLVTCVIKGGNLASTLTLGQFIKALSSFVAPYLAMWGATAVIPSLGYDWRVLFVIFLVVGAVATAALAASRIDEPRKDDGELPPCVIRQFLDAFRLLSPKGGAIVLLSFLGIMCHVGIDVGTNTTAPKVLMERLGMTLNDAAFATSLYFIFRTAGCFTGSFLLRVLKTRLFFLLSLTLMALGMAALLVGSDTLVLYAGIALIGYGNSNVFSVCFANALTALPEKQNEVSGLMIMGIVGGAVFPPLMGLASDAVGQAGAVICMLIGVAYLFVYAPRVKN